MEQVEADAKEKRGCELRDGAKALSKGSYLLVMLRQQQWLGLLCAVSCGRLPEGWTQLPCFFAGRDWRNTLTFLKTRGKKTV